MNGQLDIFSIDKEPLKITKPIRLIECFAGYGSQALSLKYLNVPFEHHRICEWAVKSIQAYKDLHMTDDNTDYSKDLSLDDVIDYLYQKGISSNYNEPMSREQIARLGNKARTIYNNIIATNNLVSVCNVKGEDLAITDTDKYTYLLTLSLAKICQMQDLKKVWEGIVVHEVVYYGKLNESLVNAPKSHKYYLWRTFQR